MIKKYLEIKTREPTVEVLLKIMNILENLTLVEWNENTEKILFNLMRDTKNKDYVIIKMNGFFTDKQLSMAEHLNFNGHTISFVDKKWIKYHKTGLLGLLDTIATVRSKGHYRRKNSKGKWVNVN